MHVQNSILRPRYARLRFSRKLHERSKNLYTFSLHEEINSLSSPTCSIENFEIYLRAALDSRIVDERISIATL